MLIAFAVDYLVELVLAGDRARYVRREWTSLGIVVAQALALVPALAGFGVLRVLRAGRHAARFALGLAGMTWLTAAVGFTLAEDVGDGQRVESFFDALWWSSTTITTVGYGDIFPVTTAGRIVGMVTMLVGITTFAVVTAKLGEFLVRAAREDDDREVAPRS